MKLTLLATLPAKVRAYIKPKSDRNAVKIRRRRKLAGLLWRTLPTITLLPLLAGYVWMLAIPLSMLRQGTYIDENALQPGQVNTYWNWGDVHHADQYLTELQRLHNHNATSEDISGFIVAEFEKIGIPASSQRYSFQTTSGYRNGTNSYAISSSPRTAGTEAIIISASWLSRTGEGDGTLNLRGVASILSLAGFLTRHSLWAKDLIFVISDGYLDGMQAWITTYHGVSQSNLHAEPLRLSSGVIWTALNIDYPGHSFSHLGVFFNGLNGRLPNQDLINSFQSISRWTGGVPVLIYDHMDPRDFRVRQHELTGIPSWFPEFVKENDGANEYAHRAKNMLRHVYYQAQGKSSGVHGLLHQFRIDAITLFAVPAPGPHGFHAIGRIVESTLRTTNNLLERLHASFFFYMLVETTAFLKIGSYLPSVILISVAMLLTGLRAWVSAGWVQVAAQVDAGTEKDKSSSSVEQKNWSRRERPVLKALSIMLVTHAMGILAFGIITRSWFLRYQTACSITLCIISFLLPLAIGRALTEPSSPRISPLSTVLKSFNLCLTSTVTSVISVFNFSLAAVLAILLGVPLCYSVSVPSTQGRILRYIAYFFLAMGWTATGYERLRDAVMDWELLGVWFAPFVCIVYTPLVLQAGIICLLPP